MLTVGVDLAAEPAATAVASVAWSTTGAWLRELVLPAEDEAVVDAVMRADKVGIDCPLGWPEPFVTFVNAHQSGTLSAPVEVVGRDWLRGLAYRRTDEAVRAATHLVPLSVAADRIGHTAMRCAGLLAQLAERNRPVDRLGNGAVVEVYPAASLRQWALPYRGFKGPGNRAVLNNLVDALLAAAPWLHLGADEQLCRQVDHALDAVVCALTAYAAWRGLTAGPDEDQARAARTEGWIALPTTPIAAIQPAVHE